MNWNNSVWLYCERGTAGGLWAEPVNAASNILFLLVVLAGIWMYGKLPAARKSADHILLIGLVLLTGLGSLSFHLLASQWSELAHMAPLVLFLAVFLAFALGRFLDVPPGWSFVIVSLFVLASGAGLTMSCGTVDQALQPLWSVTAGAKEGATSCLNGTFGYLPALIVLLVLAVLLRVQRHKAAPSLMLSTLLFLVSMIFHMIDHLYCTELKIAGHVIGTHFVWHGLNALVLLTLLRASMIHQNRPPVQEIIPPDPRRQQNGD